jgi:hypothetical protein
MNEPLRTWAQLRTQCLRVERYEFGATLWFDKHAERQLRLIAHEEQIGGSLLDFELTSFGDCVRLVISSDQPEAAPVIAMVVERASIRQRT